MKYFTPALMLAVCLSMIFGGRSSVAAPSTSERKPAKVYFLEFEANTLYGVSAESIKNHYDISSLVKGDFKKVIDLLKQPTKKGKFSSNKVRLRIDLGQKDILLVDCDGNVRRGAEDYALSAKEFEELKLRIWLMIPKPQAPVSR